MDPYIDSIIKIGKILIGGVMIFFVLWYVIKDAWNANRKDSDEPD